MKFTLTIVAAILLLAGLGAWMRVSEWREDNAAVRACGLYPGDFVVGELDGARGMVTGAVRGMLRIRFAVATERTETHATRPDGSIAREPYAEIWMACYEVHKP